MPPTTHLPSPPDIPSNSLHGASPSPATAAATAASSKPWIVQKYGGTSVGKFLPTIVDSIAPEYLRAHKVAIVCSARSGQTKALGTTNLLLQAAKQALETDAAGSEAGGINGHGNGNGGSLSNSVSSLAGTSSESRSAFDRSSSLSRSVSTLNVKLAEASLNGGSGTREKTTFNDTVDRILSDHIEAARSVVTKDAELLSHLERDLEEDCDRLRDFLLAAKIIQEISPRSKDIIMGIGERLSCRIVVGALRNGGIPAELVGLETIVDAAFLESLPSAAAGSIGGSDGRAVHLDQTFYDALSTRLGTVLSSVEGVPVVTGYFGTVPGSLLDQVGRGYTDLCAALCAVGLKAQELQIWKEVDGVFTADPRKVPTARLIPAITPEEAAELTYYGSEVIHPFTMEQAIKRSVPIRIKNVENPRGAGTVIFPDHEGELGGDHAIDGKVEQPRTPSVHGNSGSSTPWGSGSGFTPGVSLGEDLSSKPRRLPTAVTIKDDIIVINVHSNRKTISHGFFARIFTVLDRHGVVVDLISTSEVHVSMAMNGSFRRGQMERIRDELQSVGTVSVLRDMVIVSLVGKQMRNMVGVAGRMFTTLAEGNVNIEMISQGANEINISCVVHKRNALKAINLIHYSVLEVSPKPANVQSGAFGPAFF